MRKVSQNISKPTTTANKKSTATHADDNLSQLAFDNVAEAHVIIIVSTGKIIMANSACCKLLGYSKKELLTKKRADIFDIKEGSFKKMMKQRTAEGKSKALVFAIKKSGKPLPCEITSAVFIGEHGIEKSITTITDVTVRLQNQKNIDSRKAKIVADDIVKVATKQKAIDVKKEKVVADNIVMAKSKQKAIDVKKEKIIANNIVIAKSKQKNIDKQKQKIVDDNIAEALAKADAMLAENNEWIKYIAQSSYDVMWDWDTTTGQIYVGDSIAEVFGYKLKNNTMDFRDFCHCLVTGEREAVENKLLQAVASGSKTWEDSFTLKRRDGSLAATTSRASIVRDDEGKAIRLIGAIQDVSSEQDLGKKLQEQIAMHEEESEKFLLATRLSFDVIWDWNLTTNDVFIGEGFEELFGYHIKNNKGNMITDWSNYLHPDDKKIIKKELHLAIISSTMKWEHAYRVTRANGSEARVYVRASIIRDTAGKAYRMIGAMQDLSRQKELEEKLDIEIRLKEKQITDAAEDAKEMERSNIGKELHDNINQLLGASRMFLEMAKKGGPNTAMYLSRSSEYTLTAIEEIRKLSKGLSTDIIKNLGLCAAIENIADDTMEVSSLKIKCALYSFNEKSVNEKLKLNIFRIVQEQLNNIIKHAKARKITIKLLQNKKMVQLAITDDGIGFDTLKKQNGIGVDNIKSRAATYNGTADFVSQPGRGCELRVAFPIAV
ncbi:PAS domain-containing protein [Ferruginibacter sp. SUN106]|uniref:PAS domain-containing sensor histidine kinase n=1 Tax=Ferruginibacter sp. SUN106 TaxID=2978348 RepID=UPI003D35CC4E